MTTLRERFESWKPVPERIFWSDDGQCYWHVFMFPTLMQQFEVATYAGYWSAYQAADKSRAELDAVICREQEFLEIGRMLKKDVCRQCARAIEATSDEAGNI